MLNYSKTVHTGGIVQRNSQSAALLPIGEQRAVHSTVSSNPGGPRQPYLPVVSDKRLHRQYQI